MSKLTKLGFPVPSSFYVNILAYQKFVTSNGLDYEISNFLNDIDIGDIWVLGKKSAQLQALFLSYDVPNDVLTELDGAYSQLSKVIGCNGTPIAVRSSAPYEDMLSSSFAGQHDSYLNVIGNKDLVRYVKMCWASLWNTQATYYRHSKGIKHDAAAMAIVIQAMIQPVFSGTIFLANPLSGDLSESVINSVSGTGDGLSDGTITPDTFVIDNASGVIKSRGAIPHLEPRDSVSRNSEHGLSYGGGQCTLSDVQLLRLHRLCKNIQEHYMAAQDIEWVYDGVAFHILQSRPITAVG